MATNTAPAETSVLVRLSVTSPGNIDHPERRILLTASNPTAILGRSSNRPALHLQPAVSNGWYNSPVMSRHHAHLQADFEKQTVSIRDAGSMHGTFLNKEQVYSETPSVIRPGDELILGMPVFRHQEEYQPALVQVDSLAFCEGLSPAATTLSKNTFVVPEDCDYSSDGNESMDEAHVPVDFGPPVADQPVPVVSISFLPQTNEATDMTIDHTSTGCPPLLNEASTAPVEVTYIDDDSDEMESTCDSDDDMGLAEGHLDVDFDSDRPLSDDEDQDMEDESDAGEDSAEADSDMSERSPFDNTESEDGSVDEADQTESDSQEQPPHGPWATAVQGDAVVDSVLRIPDARPILPYWGPETTPRSQGWGSALAWGPRSSSPSDFVFSHCRITAPALENVDIDAQKITAGAKLATPIDVAPVQTGERTHEDQTSSSIAELAHKSGKPEFFEAWAANKKIMDQSMSSLNGEADALKHDNFEVCDARSHLMGFRRETCPRQAADSYSPEAAADVCKDLAQFRGQDKPQWEQQRLQYQSRALDTVSTERISPAETISNEWTTKAPPIEEPLEKETAKIIIKRKAAAISEAAPEEVEWAQPSVPAQSSEEQAPLPSPPPSPEVVAHSEDRPAKKMKKIAEAVGYAALGGFSVGAAVLGSLIYTAPNFV